MYCVILITVRDFEESQKISQALLEEKLIACANIIKDVHSTFQWKGKIESEKEVLLVLKTKQKLFEKIIKKIKVLHSYDVPEIIALPIVEGSQNYLDWMNESINE